MAGHDASFNVLLFNLSGNLSGTGYENIRQSEIHRVLSDFENDYPDGAERLFILCQDNITGPKHKTVAQFCGLEDYNIPYTQNVAVYNRKPHNVKIRYRHCIVKELLGTPDFPSSLEGRLLAASVTHPGDIHILLLSWHGPQNNPNGGKMSPEDKQQYFSKMIDSCKEFCSRKKYSVMLLGGDFNIDAREIKLPPLCKVHCDYTQENKIDFMVSWCAKGYSVLTKDKKVFGTEEKAYFNHPIVWYQVKVSKPPQQQRQQQRTQPDHCCYCLPRSRCGDECPCREEHLYCDETCALPVCKNRPSRCCTCTTGPCVGCECRKNYKKCLNCQSENCNNYTDVSLKAWLKKTEEQQEQILKEIVELKSAVQTSLQETKTKLKAGLKKTEEQQKKILKEIVELKSAVQTSQQETKTKLKAVLKKTKKTEKQQKPILKEIVELKSAVQTSLQETKTKVDVLQTQMTSRKRTVNDLTESGSSQLRPNARKVPKRDDPTKAWTHRSGY